MADLIFNVALKKLSWPKKSLSWKAVSGPFGSDVLPKGVYDVGRREITSYTNSVGVPFKDKTGFGFFVPNIPYV
ncbi:MAG: hypothetical protein KZQ76_12605 [Candidatus Thiodiazotropha sp. (ex Epidulcina cf. delphinae)]|nr:hypothetical protein [Candidatus Thiodiazotropha sp. (ex Epidulcina cf. delphinae)]